MAERKCNYPGCERKHHAKGYCDKHYDYLRKNGSFEFYKPRDGAAKRFLLEAIKKDCQECIEWPFAKTRGGYGTYFEDRKGTTAHRAVLILKTGKDEPTKQAAHKCGNRGCVNPNCLYWATPKENAKDKIEHETEMLGTKNPQSKITAEIALAIARAQGSQAAIARELGVSRKIVRSVRSGLYWSHVTGISKKPKRRNEKPEREPSADNSDSGVRVPDGS